MSANHKILQQKMLIELEKSLGIVSQAAKKAGIERKTHYLWLKNDPEYKEAVDNLTDIVLDFAEAKLFTQIDAGDTTATIFLLKYRGGSRGYRDKPEITIKNESADKLIDKLFPTVDEILNNE